MNTSLALSAPQPFAPMTEVEILDRLILANKMLQSRISEHLKVELRQFVASLETTLRFQVELKTPYSLG